MNREIRCLAPTFFGGMDRLKLNSENISITLNFYTLHSDRFVMTGKVLQDTLMKDLVFFGQGSIWQG